MNIENLTHLYHMLAVEAMLRPHSGFANLKKAAHDALVEMERELGGPVMEEIPAEPQLFPADSGVIQKETKITNPPTGAYDAP